MKYIDADKLRSVLQNTINSMKEKDIKGERYDAFLNGKLSICEELLGCIASLQQEQPKFKVGDLIVSKYNPHLTYKILSTNIPNELGKTDYKVEIFTDGKPGLLGKPHNIRLISSDKIEDWGELVQQEVDLEKEIDRLWESFSEEMSGPHNLFDVYRRLARHFWNKGYNARKEE